MRVLYVDRHWSYKTKNGRWTLMPCVPALVPDAVAIAAEIEGVALPPPQQASDVLQSRLAAAAQQALVRS